MRNIKHFIRYPLLMLIGLIPFWLDIKYYDAGAPAVMFLASPVVAALGVLYYHSTNHLAGFLFLQAYLVVCTLIAEPIAARLYYENISSDVMTPVIGKLVMYHIIIRIVIAAIIGAVLKKRKNRESPR